MFPSSNICTSCIFLIKINECDVFIPFSILKWALCLKPEERCAEKNKPYALCQILFHILQMINYANAVYCLHIMILRVIYPNINLNCNHACIHKVIFYKNEFDFYLKECKFLLVLIKWFYVTLICLQLLLWWDREKKSNANIANVLYCLSLVILILVLRCVGWIWYPFFILRVIYISLFVINKIISREQIYQWII